VDSSTRIWLCTPQQTSSKEWTFLAKNQQLFNAMLMGKLQTPPLEQLINQIEQPMASTTMMTSSQADETGASVAPGKKHHSRVMEQMC